MVGRPELNVDLRKKKESASGNEPARGNATA
jgi:hypothetical protein